MFLEVEPCENTDKSFNMVYKEISPPREVYCLKYAAPSGEKPAQLTGWDAETNSPCPVYACRVEESGDGLALLVFGGSGGIRMKDLEDESEWNCRNPNQWSETHLVYPADSFIVYKDEI